MRCYECGYQNSSDAKVCIKCGTKLSAAPPGDAKPSAPASGAPSKPAGHTSGGPGSANPTMVGRVSEAPSWDNPGKAPSAQKESKPPSAGEQASKSGNVITCSACGYYPLRVAPSKASPCLNCGSTGSGESSSTIGITSLGSAGGGAEGDSKTVRISEVNLGGDAQKFSFTLEDQSGQKKLNFEGDLVSLKRSDLDPGNSSISSEAHLLVKHANGKIYIEDKSSNGATFVQVMGQVEVKPGTMIIVGNKVYKLDAGKS